ncbi:hypothetical protein C8R44DRAFT_882400 [Mycena epipterygia]|nr:hypothetical protein C8R44DRAFT_882400 [Mycena epipterygia]
MVTVRGPLSSLRVVAVSALRVYVLCSPRVHYPACRCLNSLPPHRRGRLRSPDCAAAFGSDSAAPMGGVYSLCRRPWCVDVYRGVGARVCAFAAVGSGVGRAGDTSMFSARDFYPADGPFSLWAGGYSAGVHRSVGAARKVSLWPGS